jgi:hypothetical protein
MKAILLLTCISCLVFSGCSSKMELLPADTWSEGCAEFTPSQGAYRLVGLCCTSITFPEIKLDKGRAFSVKATYYTFNGAGIINFPLTVNGQLSNDGSTLTLKYSINSTLTVHTLKLGRATVSCDCGCN